MISKRLLAFIVLFLVLLFGLLYGLSRSHSSQQATIDYVHSHDVAVYDASESQTSKAVLAQHVSASGESLKLKKNHTYIVKAKGESGYEDSSVGFVLTDEPKTININPFYSKDKLADLLKTEQGAIKQALSAAYPQISLYKVDNGKLYHWGDWYGTILRYKGSYGQSSDSLRVVLAKEGGTWKVKTDPPNITLSKFVFPDVPVDILRDVNNSFKADSFENIQKSIRGTRLH